MRATAKSSVPCGRGFSSSFFSSAFFSSCFFSSSVASVAASSSGASVISAAVPRVSDSFFLVSSDSFFLVSSAFFLFSSSSLCIRKTLTWRSNSNALDLSVASSSCRMSSR